MISASLSVVTAQRMLAAARPSLLAGHTRTQLRQKHAPSRSKPQVTLVSSSRLPAQQQPRQSRQAAPVISPSSQGASSLLLYSHNNRHFFRMLYLSGFSHLLLWSAIAGLAFYEMNNAEPGFLSKPVLVSGSAQQNSASSGSEDSTAAQPATVKIFGLTKQWPSSLGLSMKTVAVTGGFASIGVMFMLFVHRSASRFVSQLELVNGTTLRIKSSVIFGNAFREVPLQQASLSSAVYTGHGATGTDLPATQTPWYRRIFKSRSSRLYLIVERPRMRLSIDRLGVFPNPQFLDKLFAEKDTWLARTSAQKRA